MRRSDRKKKVTKIYFEIYQSFRRYAETKAKDQDDGNHSLSKKKEKKRGLH